MKFFICYLFLGILSLVHAREKIISFSLGSLGTTYTESQSTIKSSTASSTPAAGAASTVPLDMCYEFIASESKSYFFEIIGPLLPSSEDRYFYGGGGMNFYFKSVSSPSYYSDQNFNLTILPTWRYYWGLDGGAAYLIYSTKTAKKSDILGEIGAHVGTHYAINKTWSLRGQLGFARGVGVLTSATTIKILIGISRPVDFL
jgi:hypothetical protein